MASVFLSHSSKDKPLARRIVKDLKIENINVWFDESEIVVGDSIIKGIQDGLKEADFVAVLLTDHAVNSAWVEKEWYPQIGVEATTRNVVILPLKAGSCSIPLLLRDKKYADLEKNYSEGIREVVTAVTQHTAWRETQSPAAPRGNSRLIESLVSNEFLERINDQIHELLSIGKSIYVVEGTQCTKIGDIANILINKFDIPRCFCNIIIFGRDIKSNKEIRATGLLKGGKSDNWIQNLVLELENVYPKGVIKNLDDVVVGGCNSAGLTSTIAAERIILVVCEDDEKLIDYDLNCFRCSYSKETREISPAHPFDDNAFRDACELGNVTGITRMAPILGQSQHAKKLLELLEVYQCTDELSKITEAFCSFRELYLVDPATSAEVSLCLMSQTLHCNNNKGFEKLMLRSITSLGFSAQHLPTKRDRIGNFFSDLLRKLEKRDDFHEEILQSIVTALWRCNTYSFRKNIMTEAMDAINTYIHNEKHRKILRYRLKHPLTSHNGQSV